MMARTNAKLVIEELGEDYDYENCPPLTLRIRMAYAIVTRVKACAIQKGSPLTDEELILLETLVAAHYYACSDKPYGSRNTEGAGGSFHGQTAKGFEFTAYGQKALSFDSSGCLDVIDKNKVARGAFLGTIRSDSRWDQLGQ